MNKNLKKRHSSRL